MAVAAAAMGFGPPRAVPAVVLISLAATWASIMAYRARNAASTATLLASENERVRLRLPAQATANNLTVAVDHSRGRSLFADIHLERTTYKLPRVLERNLADWEDVPAEGRGNNLPVFWHVLKSGGTTIKLMYAQCYRLVEACETGVLVDAAPQHQREEGQRLESRPIAQSPVDEQAPVAERQSDNFLSPWEWMQRQQAFELNDNKRRELVPMPLDPSDGDGARPQQNGRLRVVAAEDGRRYINVDVTTPEGILHASQLGFASSDLTDVMFSPLLHEIATSLLNGDRKGRMFAIFRHPAERVVSMFYYLKSATWEPTYNPEYASWTIDDYVRSSYCESNWMVRSLTDKMTGPLEGSDILVAQEVLRRKCLVGLMDRMEESVNRFHHYFAFGEGNALSCSNDHFVGKGSGSNSHKHPMPDRGSETWAILERKNQLDIRLFEYAQKLFEDQGRWMKDKKLIF